MRTLAASGDTWGISGPAFLLTYVLFAALAIGATIVVRRALTRGPAPQTLLPLTDPMLVALLRGGPTLAVPTAIAALRSRHLVAAVPSGGIVASRPTAEGLGPVEAATLRAVASGRTRPWTILADGNVQAAISAAWFRLERDGLVPSARRRTYYRLAGLAPVPVLLLGIARFVAGVAGGKPVGVLTVLLATLFVVELVFLLVSPPLTTRAGRAAVRQEVRRHEHLRPSYRPAWGAYGSSGAAMGVALFGTASLTAADPAFAVAAGIPSAGATGSPHYSSDSSGSSCSSSSSCASSTLGGSSSSCSSSSSSCSSSSSSCSSSSSSSSSGSSCGG
ncbi:TIGR04222 domain-containing membrane protein [Cryptosporangium minutisporangium]|uniref:TIGR04222 domain-containing membrane protein n=1 Tax=Cryptosporangium minutisporangium TaxID=113569 RepID=A0ABP6T451_9ACTN